MGGRSGAEYVLLQGIVLMHRSDISSIQFQFQLYAVYAIVIFIVFHLFFLSSSSSSTLSEGVAQHPVYCHYYPDYCFSLCCLWNFVTIRNGIAGLNWSKPVGRSKFSHNVECVEV